MIPQVRIADIAIWFKHVESPELQQRLRALRDDEYINLEADGVVGRWVRMRTGRDGRPTEAIRPDGNMKNVWGNWFRERRGDLIPLREVQVKDDYLATIASLFPEWESPEDEQAFRDL